MLVEGRGSINGDQLESDGFEPGHGFFESFYFMVVTVSSVGYGDFSPKTQLGKLCVTLLILMSLIVIQHRLYLLAELEWKHSSQSGGSDEESNVDIRRLMDDVLNMHPMPSEHHEQMHVESWRGWCRRCDAPRWTNGTSEAPRACTHCYYPVLTVEQIRRESPDVAAAMEAIVTREEDEALQIMLDAKESTERGLLPLLQRIVEMDGKNHDGLLQFLDQQASQTKVEEKPVDDAKAETEKAQAIPSNDDQENKCGHVRKATPIRAVSALSIKTITPMTATPMAGLDEQAEDHDQAAEKGVSDV